MDTPETWLDCEYDKARQAYKRNLLTIYYDGLVWFGLVGTVGSG